MRIYLIDHFYNPKTDEGYVLFIKNNMDIKTFIETLACIHFRFEELVQMDGFLEDTHLAMLLEKFFHMQNVTEDYRSNLPEILIKKEERQLLNIFNFHNIKMPLIIRIDMYKARESCVPMMHELMEKRLPKDLSFDEEMFNLREHYFCMI